ncbi:MAG: hypothetical protein KDI61_02630 [Alphaproteobacteria bacterium]|nr:hypothetical protein [Alphaproteobacteria bacterium]MCB1839145.1 hypothetical protein [Alphaproteobacteria bacterium]
MRFLVAFAVLFFAFLPQSAHAAEKRVIIRRDVIEEARGNDTVCGVVSRVGHEVIFVKSDEPGRVKVDVDDISFPKPLDDLIDKESRVIATGRFVHGTLVAHTIVVIRGTERRTYVSHKPVDVKVKTGGDDINIRVVP